MFVHLLTHTEYSMNDSLLRVKPLVKAVRGLDMPACAVTDQNNLFALVKFYNAAQAGGIKPLVGSDVWLRTKEGTLSRLVLLCQDYAGYLNLSRLVSRAYLEGQQQGVPALSPAWLRDWHEGLIVLSGGHTGDLGQALLAGKPDLARQQLADWKRLFGDRFYLQLQRTGREGEEDYLHAAVNLALETQTPVVAVNDVRFLKREDFEAHEIRVAIHDGFTLDDSRRPRRYSEEQYLRSAAEMAELFADLPESLENTVLIAQRCNLTLTLGKNYLPIFPTGEKSTADYLRDQARAGLEQRLHFLFKERLEEHRAVYAARLEIELEVIINMDFPGYFLIVADFIQWAKNNRIPVGPGRGSGAGSLVAYALSITDIDPLQYDLLFERFLNPERVSMPDFDIDFCMEGRDRVIDYVADRYGREKVSQIITYGSMAAKAVIRDVGRVLGHPYGFVDQIAKLIPFELGITLDKALEQEAQLRERYEQDEEVQALINMARTLEGLTRNAGKHAGGVVIAPTALTDFSPLYREDSDDGSVVTQFDKNDVEAIGLVKFDFLGLRTLTIIDWALDNIQHMQPGAARLEILGIPLDDAGALKIMKEGKTTAVFQLESRGIQELIKRLKPDCFEDIIALVALYRPGPLQSGMVDDFINRKHGAKIEYPHPDLEPILKPTYGIILYQEQVMQIARVLSGYSLGGADLLRRAMGKKKPEEMAKQRGTFVDGALKNGTNPSISGYIFDLIEKFAGYGFNKSHSAAYALVSYQTAWLKAHHPAAFMAAVLSSDMDNTDKVVGFIEECRSMGLQILPPHVNHSAFSFTVLPTEPKAIRYGLGAIKGAGKAALDILVEERKTHGAYQNLFDFCKRIDLRKCNRRVLDSLIKAGALDDLGGPDTGPERAVLWASLDTALKLAEQQAAVSATGQNDLFGILGGGGSAVASETSKALPYTFGVPLWTAQARLLAEKETLGLYLTGHPIDQYLPELERFTRRLGGVSSTGRGQKAKVAGLIMEVRLKNTSRGRLAFVTLDDKSGRLELKLYAEVFDKNKDLLQKDQVLIAEGEISEDTYNGGFSMNATQLWNMAGIRSVNGARLRLTLQAADEAQAALLAQQLEPYRPGNCPVSIEYRRADGLGADLHLGNAWRIQPDDELVENLQTWLGVAAVRLVYEH